MLAEGQGEEEVADVFAVESQGARQGAVVGAEPAVEGLGKRVGV